MAVRPFYVTADVEGRANPLSGGPKRKDGRMTIELHQRDKGDITTPYRICQRPMDDNQLITEIYYFGDLIHSYTTTY